MPEALKTFLQKYVELPDEDWGKIRQDFEKLVFKKDEFILEEGKI